MTAAMKSPTVFTVVKFLIAWNDSIIDSELRLLNIVSCVYVPPPRNCRCRSATGFDYTKSYEQQTQAIRSHNLCPILFRDFIDVKYCAWPGRAAQQRDHPIC